MKREYLKGLELNDDVIDKIMAEHGKTVNDTKSKLDAATNEVATYKEQVQSYDDKIKELQSSSSSKEEYETKIKELQSDVDKVKAESNNKLSELKLNYELDNALKEAGAHNPKTVKSLLEMDKVKLVENGVEGLKEQIDKIRSEEEYLFKKTDNAKPPFVNHNGNSNNGGATMSKEAIMGIKDNGERQKAIKDNMHLFQN